MTLSMTRWLLDTALAAGVILLVGTALVSLLRQPARRQRVGEWTLAACLLVGILQAMALPRVRLGWLPEGAGVASRSAEGVEAFSDAELAGGTQGSKIVPSAGANGDGAVSERQFAGAQRGTAWTWAGANWALILVAAYAAAASVAGMRLVAGHVALRRMVRVSHVAAGDLERTWKAMIEGLPRPAELRISSQIGKPICFGVWHPVVLIPEALVARAAAEGREEELRIVLLHELVHVRRRDAITWLLASVARVVFFYQPLLWLLEKQLRLAQEFVADAWAAEQASSPVAYAENLLRLLKEDIRPVPATAAAAVRGPSEFYRRMQRLLTEKSPTEKTCDMRCSVAGGAAVLALAIFSAGISVQASRQGDAGGSAAAVAERPEDRGVAYLLARQEKGGGWLSEYGPAPTALVVRALLQHGVSADSPEVRRGLAFLESFRQSDNGFYGDAEPTYNTAIVLSTLAMGPGEKYSGLLEGGKAFLEARRRAESARKPGGWYASAPAIDRARPKWLDPSERSAELVLESYGAMTYAGLKSMVYAGLSRDDARVKRSAAWLKGNWTLEKNPGLGSAEGLYYYYHLMARTLRAQGEDRIIDARGREHAWREELAGKLAAQQRGDGSWINTGSGRWLEDRPELVTAYAVLALQEARK